MARNKHDSGNWHPNAADPVKMTIKQRIDTQLGVTSPEVREAMRREEEFLNSVRGKLGEAPFTDRRPIPGRDRLIP